MPSPPLPTKDSAIYVVDLTGDSQDDTAQPQVFEFLLTDAAPRLYDALHFCVAWLSLLCYLNMFPLYLQTIVVRGSAFPAYDDLSDVIQSPEHNWSTFPPLSPLLNLKSLERTLPVLEQNVLSDIEKHHLNDEV